MKILFNSYNYYIKKMVLFEEKVATHYKWTLELTNKIIFEYERFMKIRSSNEDTYPPNKIEDLWKFHILCTENYINYSNNKFNKIIYHDNMINLS
jgi:hypothetical protein